MSLTTSEIIILAAPVVSTLSALVMGAAVYLSVLRRRKDLPPHEAVVIEEIGEPERDASHQLSGKPTMFRVRRDPLTGQITGKLSTREQLGLSMLLDNDKVERAAQAK